MSNHEDASVGSDEKPKPDTTGRWVWGSICVAIFLWLVAACTPWLNRWLGSRGQVGDFLGGIASPVFGFVGMVLVYRSFQAQVKANQLQIEALKAEREARQADERKKKIDEGMARLERIIDSTCYVRSEPDKTRAPYRGADGIYRFCVDCAKKNARPYSDNELMLDMIRRWFFEAEVFLRRTWEDDRANFAEVAAEVNTLHVFTFAKSLNSLYKTNSLNAFFDLDLKQLREVEAMYQEAISGQFESAAERSSQSGQQA